MKKPPADIETTLIHQLDKMGIDSNTTSRFIRDLIISFSDLPTISLAHVNNRMHGLGWDYLDYHTYQLAKACFENGSLKRLQV